MPKVDSVTFKALQTYSDGSIVRWIDEPSPGSPNRTGPTLGVGMPDVSIPTRRASLRSRPQDRRPGAAGTAGEATRRRWA